MTEDRDDEVRHLRDDVDRLVRAATESDRLHAEEIALLGEVRETDAKNFVRALGSRDLIGQAKGLIMAAMRCTSDEAFTVLRDQSQRENRKLVEVASDVVRRAADRATRS